MLVDSHCHLDASEFVDTALHVAAKAAAQGVQWIVIPAVERATFNAVGARAQNVAGGV